jgi:hypothetical protein
MSLKIENERSVSNPEMLREIRTLGLGQYILWTCPLFAGDKKIGRKRMCPILSRS